MPKGPGATTEKVSERVRGGAKDKLESAMIRNGEVIRISDRQHTDPYRKLEQ